MKTLLLILLVAFSVNAQPVVVTPSEISPPPATITVPLAEWKELKAMVKTTQAMTPEERNAHAKRIGDATGSLVYEILSMDWKGWAAAAFAFYASIKGARNLTPLGNGRLGAILGLLNLEKVKPPVPENPRPNPTQPSP